MPFDPSGNFTRVHNWQQDRDNGIRILADRHDAEDDNFAAAFNQVFLRGGIVPMTGDLNMGGYNINTIKAGSAAAPSLTWELDADTGFYQAGPAVINFSSNGQEKVSFGNGLNTTGCNINIRNVQPILGFYTTDGATQLGALVHDGGSMILSNAVAAGALVFHTAGAEKMRIQPNGRVGIGTTGPITKLHILGDGILVESNTDANGFVSYRNTVGDWATGMLGVAGWKDWHIYNNLGGLGSAFFIASDTNRATFTKPLAVTGAGGFNIGTLGGAARIDYTDRFSLLTPAGIGAIVNTGPIFAGPVTATFAGAAGAAASMLSLQNTGAGAGTQAFMEYRVAGAQYATVSAGASAANTPTIVRGIAAGGSQTFTLGGTEVWRTHSNACLGIGTEAPDSKLHVSGPANSNPVMKIADLAGSLAYIQPVGAGGVRLAMQGGGVWNVMVDSGIRLLLGSTYVHPQPDNSMTLGAGGARWTAVYATTGVVNPSDAREKTPLTPLTASELAAAKTIAAGVGTFKWLPGNGYDEDTHVGVIAQEVIAAMEAQGLDALTYGFVRYDEWEAVEPVEEVPAQDAEVDAEGRMVKEAVFGVTGTPGSPAGNRYSVIYSELAMFIAAAQEQRLAALEALL